MNKLMKKKKKGFTLIELIAVIAILAVLAVVAVPRVIKYVDRSKKVAIQTEASTIYNAAEAAYNDGKLKQTKNENGESKEVSISAEGFDKADVNQVVATLKREELLNNASTDKLGVADTLGKLKAVMNANTDSLTISSDGKLTGTFNDSTGAYQGATATPQGGTAKPQGGTAH